MSPNEIFQFELNIERQAVGLLIAAGAGDSTNVRGRLDDEEFAKDAEGIELPRMSIECGIFTKASGQMAFTRQGVAFYNHFRGSLSVEITTPRVGGLARHHAWLGVTRRLFSRGAVPGFRPYELLEIEEAAGSIALVKEGERDRSRLVFTLQIAIPNDVVDYSETQPLPAIATA